MNKVYVIMTADYEDYRIEGYALNEADAAQICAQHNANEEDEYGDYWYFEVAELMSIPEETLKIIYVHDVIFRRVDGEWKMCDWSGNFHYYTELDVECPEHSDLEECSGNIYCTIVMDVNDREKAEKIAWDMLGDYLRGKGEY